MTASKNFNGSAGHNGLLQAARSYTARNWPVIPSRRNAPVIAKKTRGQGVQDATTDLAIIREWWARFPKADVGIATESCADLVALNVFFDNGGDSSLSDLERRQRLLPMTVSLPLAFISNDGQLLICRLTQADVLVSA